ncbi:LytR/AlgR family response regulator transcription factor [Flavobacterium tegetincola]|uniref:LytR/AlgR family response regulator transcription factor n=1 Tax=Flavobacterium tegetincola TaxID=150172 RepID=UPI000421B1A3|nr:response regulator transcription factor [Flavobacterium tegetincola]
MQYSFLVLCNDDFFSKEVTTLFESFPNYLCSAVSKDTQTALKHIKKFKPELVFIQLSTDLEQNNLRVQTIGESIAYLDPFPYFVAISPNEVAAVAAFSAGFSDYLIGVLSLHSLGKTLFKFEKRTPEKLITNLCIKSYSDYQFINLQDVVYLKADNNTTDIQLMNGIVVNAFKTLKYYENTLPFYFLRIHKSYIVNINHVSRIHFSKAKCYINYDEIIPFSPNYRENIDVILRKIDG